MKLEKFHAHAASFEDKDAVLYCWKRFMNRVVTESAKSVLQVGNMMDWLQFNGDSGSNDLLLC